MTTEEFKVFAEKNGDIEKVLGIARQLKAEGIDINEATLSERLYESKPAIEVEIEENDLPPVERITPSADEFREAYYKELEKQKVETATSQPKSILTLAALLPFVFLMMMCSPMLSRATGIEQVLFFKGGIALWFFIFALIFLINMVRAKKFNILVLAFFIACGYAIYSAVTTLR